MTARAPLVIIGGQIQQIPAGDSLPARSTGAIPWKVPSGETWVLPQYAQGTSFMGITVDGFYQVDGFLLEADFKSRDPMQPALMFGGM